MPDDGQHNGDENTDATNDSGASNASGEPATGTGGTDNGGENGSGSTDKGTAAGSNGDADNGGESTDWKKHARTWETRAGENKSRAEKAEQERDEAAQTLAAVRKAFGLDSEEDDPKKVAEQAQKTVAEREAELRAIKIERAAERAGRKAGADVDKLTDSKSFAAAAAKLDPAAEDFADAMNKLVAKHLEEHPHFKAKPDTPPPSSQDMTGGGENGGPAQSGGNDIDAIRKRRRERRVG